MACLPFNHGETSVVSREAVTGAEENGIGLKLVGVSHEPAVSRISEGVTSHPWSGVRSVVEESNQVCLRGWKPKRFNDDRACIARDKQADSEEENR